MRNIFFTGIQLKQGYWYKEGGYLLSGKTIGVIGVNHIGKEVIHLLKSFGCKIVVTDIMDLTSYCQREQVEQVSFETSLKMADIVTLHVPSTPDTQHMINEKTLALMKPTAFLINTARGNIVDQAALKQALINQKIAGAALDVFETEPPTDSEFLALPNLMVTPHIGGNAAESVLMMGRAAIAGLEKAEVPRDLTEESIL